MELNEAIEKLKKAGLIVEETTEDALARIAANSNEAIVGEIVEEIEKVKTVKNYYEVDPDDGVYQQFEIVMPDGTWEVQFRRKGAFYWRGNSYPWRIIKNNNGGFTQIAFSLAQLRAYMKKAKAIQTESYDEDTQVPISVFRRNVKNSDINGFILEDVSPDNKMIYRGKATNLYRAAVCCLQHDNYARSKDLLADEVVTKLAQLDSINV